MFLANIQGMSKHYESLSVIWSMALFYLTGSFAICACQSEKSFVKKPLPHFQLITSLSSSDSKIEPIKNNSALSKFVNEGGTVAELYAALIKATGKANF